jgi:hypothetical protein
MSATLTYTTRRGTTEQRSTAGAHQPRYRHQQRPTQGALDRFDPSGIK